MSSFRKWLEALYLRNENGSRSQVDETNPPTRAYLTNLLLLKLLQKQGEQLQCPNEQLRKLMEARDRKAKEDNSYMFKSFASHNLPIYNGTPILKPLRTGLGAWKVVRCTPMPRGVEGGLYSVLLEG